MPPAIVLDATKRVASAHANAVGCARLVYEQHAGHDVGLAFLAPLGHLGIDLLPDLRPDLARVAREQRQEALRCA